MYNMKNTIAPKEGKRRKKMKIINESQVKKYTVAGDLGNRFTIMIESEDQWMHLSLSGDVPDSSNYWSHMGENYLDFLNSVEYQYFWSKMGGSGCGYENNYPDTIVKTKKEILSSYKELLLRYPEQKGALRDEATSLLSTIDELSENNENHILHLFYDKLNFFHGNFVDGVIFVEEKSPRHRMAFDALQFLVSDLKSKQGIQSTLECDLDDADRYQENMNFPKNR